MRAAVVTIAAGRESHLRRQAQGLGDCRLGPSLRVLVAMREADLGAWSGAPWAAGCRLVGCLDRGGDPDSLSLAKARNVGAHVAIEAGADLLIFLDADCIPGRRLIGRYVEAAASGRGALYCGPVAYLAPGPAPEEDAALSVAARAPSLPGDRSVPYAPPPDSPPASTCSVDSAADLVPPESSEEHPVELSAHLPSGTDQRSGLNVPVLGRPELGSDLHGLASLNFNHLVA